ncbi:MAG TPA: tyrosine-type recombinase/integrase [bacterium]|nr:tyrosine-type recombinase/integrase [bacterium]
MPLIMNGQPMKVVQELLGHSDIRMTDIYSHLAPNMNQDAVESLLPAKNEPKSRHSHRFWRVFQGPEKEKGP